MRISSELNRLNALPGREGRYWYFKWGLTPGDDQVFVEVCGAFYFNVYELAFWEGEPSLEETLDLIGIPCPQNTARALLRLELLDAGEHLNIWVDDGEPYQNLLAALELESDLLVLTRDHLPSQVAWQICVKKEA